MKTIKAGMDGKQMKKIAAANNMASMAGKKPLAVPGTKYKKMANDNDADDMKKKTKKKAIKHAGKFDGKSNKLGQGGRAAQMRAQGVPGGVIGNIARSEQAAPGQKNFHKGK